MQEEDLLPHANHVLSEIVQLSDSEHWARLDLAGRKKEIIPVIRRCLSPQRVTVYPKPDRPRVDYYLRPSNPQIRVVFHSPPEDAADREKVYTDIYLCFGPTYSTLRIVPIALTDTMFYTSFTGGQAEQQELEQLGVKSQVTRELVSRDTHDVIVRSFITNTYPGSPPTNGSVCDQMFGYLGIIRPYKPGYHWERVYITDKNMPFFSFRTDNKGNHHSAPPLT